MRAKATQDDGPPAARPTGDHEVRQAVRVTRDADGLPDQGGPAERGADAEAMVGAARPAGAECGYPGCGRPCAPADGPGRPPAYCDDPAHTRLSAYRRRRELAAGDPRGPGAEGARRRAGDGRAAVAGSPATAGAAQGARPVALARLRADELAAHVEGLTADLGRTLEAFTAALGRLGDVSAAEAQVEAAEADSARRVAEATA
ncbi:hypothetical protein I6A94_15655, partial [Frankia sp. CN4]|nr:hypothetical protein [Frankia nepalensis]